MWASYGNPPVVASQRAQRALITHPVPYLYPFPLTGTWGWWTISVGAGWKLIELVNQRRTRQRFHTLIWSKSHGLASLHTSSLSSMTTMCVINTSAPGFIRLHWHSNKSSDSKTLNWTTPVYILTKSGQVLCGVVVGTVVSQHRGCRMWFQILYFSPSVLCTTVISQCCSITVLDGEFEG